VISLAPRPGHEVLTSEHRRHSAWTGEGPAASLTYLNIAHEIRLSWNKTELETVSGEGTSRDHLETW